ncbi:MULTISPECIES: hypothetical protein [Actinotignum]|uniref:Uncharacterized protein n=1 Tax=Actinotignum schaalii FB123-CNA-2 TaxID=883067 RepID=S2VML5_9ACTO|nr:MULTISPECIES: hypothetical protein [Actinotignum]EPD27255.1 hypothetical protein HMPREF9237_00612 [Actinotignum schaalii FB123-CNA-2]MDY5126821.1 hypothetical protein [Actinotignum sp. SLA_B059]MDY5136361.1 hypothetical protein [Actinotignum sanguinis]MDY5138381.1 hypothetical protein [Actinotignum timonense]MDY5145002.1 hypothetical protein [Actinotignum timonense]
MNENATIPVQSAAKLAWPRDVETSIETVYAVTADRIPPFVQQSAWYTDRETAEAAAREINGAVWESQIVTTMSISEWTLVHAPTPTRGTSTPDTPEES